MEPNKIIQKLKNEEGAALVMAMMVLMVLSILGAMVGTLTVGSYRLSANNQDYNSAYYIAEAGANMAYEEIKSEVENLATDPYKKGSIFMAELEGLFEEVSLPEEAHFTYETNEEGEPYFQEQSGEIPKALVKVVSESPHTREGDIFTIEYSIQSTGIVAGKEREVEKPFKVTWVERKAEETSGNSLGIPEGASIIFDGEVDFGNNNDLTVSGEVFGVNTDEFSGKGSDIPTVESIDLDWTSIEDYLDYIPDDAILLDEYEHQTTVPGNTGNIPKIIIDTQGESINIISPTLNNSFEITGGGKVNLYVNNIGGSNNKYDLNVGVNADPSQLNVFYSGTTFELGSNSIMNGMLFAPHATVTLKNGVKVSGLLIVNKIQFSNKSGVVYPFGYTLEYPTEGSGQNQEELEKVDLIMSSPPTEN